MNELKLFITGVVGAAVSNLSPMLTTELETVGLGLSPQQLEGAANWVGLVSGILALISFALGIYLRVKKEWLNMKKWRKDNGV